MAKIDPVRWLMWAVVGVALCVPAWGQNGIPVPVDWSHKHLVITNAANPEQRIAASQDPRYISNWLRRTQALAAARAVHRDRIQPVRQQTRPKLARDWSVSLGAGRVAPAMSPAKYGFYTSSTFLIVNCTTDYVVYGLDAAATPNTSGGQANLVFLRNLYSGSNGYCGAATIASSPSGAVRSGNVVTITTTAVHSFTVGMQVAIAGVTDTSFNGTFTVASVPSTTSFTYSQTATASNSGGGTASFATASVMAAYNITTQAGGKILTSPSISLDGTKVAFVESTATASIFHVLTLDPCTYSTAGCSTNGTSATSSAAPGSGNVASMVSITYSNSSNTRSSPWIDYSAGVDAAYVGDDSGKLYRITGVFTGTPTLDATFGGSGSVTVSSGVALLAPVLAQGWLLVGDLNGTLRAVKAASPFTVAASTVSVGTGMVDPPVVDASTNGVLSAFATASIGFNIDQAIFNIASQTFAAPTSVNIGHSTAVNSHAPALDNNYYIGTIDATHGFIYACGSLAASQHPTLYRLGFTAGSPPTMSTTATSGPTLVTSNAECSPLTEFANSSLTVKDLLFVGNSSGQVQSFNITGAMPASPTATLAVPGGTSGIIVDSTQLPNQQGSSIYFTTQSNVGGNCGASNYCAIKVTQAGLL